MSEGRRDEKRLLRRGHEVSSCPDATAAKLAPSTQIFTSVPAICVLMSCTKLLLAILRSMLPSITRVNLLKKPKKKAASQAAGSVSTKVDVTTNFALCTARIVMSPSSVLSHLTVFCHMASK